MRRPACRTAAALPLVAVVLVPLTPGHAADEIEAIRRDCVAAASAVQRDEGRIRTLEHRVDLLGQDVAGRQRGLDDTRPVQERLLGVLERLSRNPPDRHAAVAASPIERARGRLLIDAMLPALRAEAHALSGEFARIAALRSQVAARQGELAETRAALAHDRERLDPLVAARNAALRRLRPDDPAAETRIAGLARDAKSIDDLVRRADAATERRDKTVPGRRRAVRPEEADPTRPTALRAFDPPQSALVLPISGDISQASGAADAADDAGRGVALSALPGAEVVAPFDGRVVYAGPFRDLGLVLIMRHGREYHSLLAGLGRVDARVDDWLLSGEPVGRMPEGSGGVLHFELRRDGRPVDPQPWLATSDEGRDNRDGDQRVRQ